MPSFDTVCEPNLPEVKNGVDNTSKEIATRFDFKGTSASIEIKDKEITLIGDADFQRALGGFYVALVQESLAPVKIGGDVLGVEGDRFFELGEAFFPALVLRQFYGEAEVEKRIVRLFLEKLAQFVHAL